MPRARNLVTKWKDVVRAEEKQKEEKVTGLDGEVI